MCVKPLRIVNRTLTYRPSFDKLYVDVPCGRCSDCVRKKHDEWFVRTYYAIKAHCQAMFFTLTYSNENLPYFKSEVCPEFPPVMCFSQSHIKAFMDKLRRYLLRHGLVTNRGMSSFVACEYGTDPDGTHRPHYHLLLLFNPVVSRIPPSLIHDLVSRYWCRLHGFIYPRYRFSQKIELQSAYKAAAYVSKYVSKDIDFFSQPQVSEFLDKSLPDDEYAKRYDEIKPYLPKHWQSHGFGASILEDVINGDTMDYFLHGIKVFGTDYSHPLPGYIKDKLLYSYKVVDGHRLRYLTDFGKMFVLQKFNADFKDYDFKLRKFFDSNYLRALFPDKFYQDVLKLSPDLCVSSFNRLCGSSTLPLYIYEKLFRGYTMPLSSSPLGKFKPGEVFPVSISQSADLQYVVDHYPDFLYARLNKPENIILVEDSARKIEHYYFRSFESSGVSRFYNDLPIFRDFELLLSCFYKIRAADLKRCSDKQLSDERKFRYIRKKYKPNV